MRTARLLTLPRSMPGILGGGGFAQPPCRQTQRGLPKPPCIPRCRPPLVVDPLNADPPGGKPPIEADPPWMQTPLDADPH